MKKSLPVMQTLDKDQYTFIKPKNLGELINSSFFFESHAKPFAFVMKMQQSRYLKLVELENDTDSIKWLNRTNLMLNEQWAEWTIWSKCLVWLVFVITKYIVISSSTWKYDAKREKNHNSKITCQTKGEEILNWMIIFCVHSLAYSFWPMHLFRMSSNFHIYSIYWVSFNMSTLKVHFE